MAAPNRLIFPLLIGLLISASPPSKAATNDDPQNPQSCAQALTETRPVEWIDLEKTLANLDLYSPSGDGDEYLLPTLMGKDLNGYMQAELFLLKYIVQRADSVSAARIFMDRFDSFEQLNRLFEKPELFLRPRLGIHKIVRDKSAQTDLKTLENFGRVTRKAFLLTLLTLANRQPFLIMKDHRVIQALAEGLLSPNPPLDVEPTFKQHKRLTSTYRTLVTALEREGRELRNGRALRLSTRSKAGRDMWNHWLGLINQWAPERVAETEWLAEKLGIKLTQVHLPRGLF